MKNIPDTAVSVIIPTYNRATHVTGAIDSVLAQTYRNYEIIVVDDGSTDNTKDILRERYAERIRYTYQPNKGPAAARNTGIHEARHELIAFLDSDDTWLPQKLELQVPLMSDPGTILSYTNWKDSKNGSGHDYFSGIGLRFDNEHAVLEHPLRTLVRKNGSGIWTSAIMCRRKAVQRVGGFDERMKIAEDIRLWFRLAIEGKFAVLPEPLAVRGWTASGEQLTQPGKSSYYKESADMRLEVFMESYARAVNSPPDVQRMLRNFIASSLADQAKYLALDGKYNSARRRAFLSLAFSPTGKAALKAITGLLFPEVFRLLNKNSSKA